MMALEYARLAVNSMRANKVRSLFTVFGVIVSVTSIITVTSLGIGIKNQLSKYVSSIGDNVLTITGGVIDGDNNSSVDKITLLLNPKNLKSSDLDLIEKLPDVEAATSFSIVPVMPERQENFGSPDGIKVISTTSSAQLLLNQPILHGGFFQASDTALPTAVIGKSVAEKFFKMNVPIGQKFTLNGRQVTVSGVLQDFQSNPLQSSIDYDHSIFLLNSFAQTVVSEPLQPFQIMASPKSSISSTDLAAQVTTALRKDRSDYVDFSVLRSQDMANITNKLILVLDRLVAVVAIITLISGGISIMNIMLVSVSERVQEIGVRKSIGATNNQILGQFIVETVVISLIGALIGIFCSLIANYIIIISTDFTPLISWKVTSMTIFVTIISGVVFGIIPALKAARKDPIMALRRL